MALIFGAPDTVPAGKMERKASNLSESVSTSCTVCQRPHGQLPCLILPKQPGHLRGQVLDMAELLDRHQVIHLDRSRLTRTIDVVPGEVNQHDVFSTVFFRC